MKHLPAALAVVQPEWLCGSLCKLQGGCPELCLFLLRKISVWNYLEENEAARDEIQLKIRCIVSKLDKKYCRGNEISKREMVSDKTHTPANFSCQLSLG